MDSNKASSLDQFSFVRIPKALPGLTVLMILLSLVFNLVITFSDLLGSSILKGASQFCAKHKYLAWENDSDRLCVTSKFEGHSRSSIELQ